jgi:hypothetical protein
MAYFTNLQAEVCDVKLQKARIRTPEGSTELFCLLQMQKFYTMLITRESAKLLNL